MPNKLFLLDGMALVYRAHFAFMARPIFTSKGVNTSALYGFTQTLLDLLDGHQPSHIAVVFDTEAPTHRHVEYPEYKAQREHMPEDLSAAIPHVRRMVEAFNIPVLSKDGFEADDIIGTLARQAEKAGYETYMVTPDKDFAQLVDANTYMLKPSRAGNAIELLKLPDILAKWGIERPDQVIDILGLMGDASDNIPGVPGIGDKTAAKLIAQFGSVENLLEHTDQLKGKQKENIEANRQNARLSKRLATIRCDVPLEIALDDLKMRERNTDALRALCIEFEFNSLGRRLVGDDFKAGRGFQGTGQGELFPGESSASKPSQAAPSPTDVPAAGPQLKTVRDVAHEYQLVTTKAQRTKLIAALRRRTSFCFDTETTGLDPKSARLLGLAISWEAHTGYYVALPENEKERQSVLEEFREVFEDEKIQKVGHNLKFDLSMLQVQGMCVAGRLFDTMLAHCLVEPDQRHGMDYLSEVYLGYGPIPITQLIGDEESEQKSMADVPLDQVAEYAAEDADVTWQLQGAMEPLLKEKGQEKVYYEIEAPLLPALVAMELEGVRIDAAALADFSEQLAGHMSQFEAKVQTLAGCEFNLNSPKQLGEVLFDRLKIADKPKKTKTGQYATDEQTLQMLAADHEIVRILLAYRTVTKLKSTYADTLPQAISAHTGRVHTTFHQAITATGRLASQNPNLQNIPIRTELGQEIRKAFVPRSDDYVLLSADYSQVELRVIAALSKDPAMIEAFRQKHDVHTATAARVHGVALDSVTPEMRRQAKMVNFGIIYGISAFGLSQRLGITRQNSAALIEHYFKQYPSIQQFMNSMIVTARERGYVETITGRRRYLRDINSANATIRNAAERTAINTPIQGSAADMIKIAMGTIHQELLKRRLKSRMLLQVHDELIFDLFKPEEKEVKALVEERMKSALPLDVPIEVEMGTGTNWLEAHG